MQLLDCRSFNINSPHRWLRLTMGSPTEELVARGLVSNSALFRATKPLAGACSRLECESSIRDGSESVVSGRSNAIHKLKEQCKTRFTVKLQRILTLAVKLQKCGQRFAGFFGLVSAHTQRNSVVILTRIPTSRTAR